MQKMGAALKISYTRSLEVSFIYLQPLAQCLKIWTLSTLAAVSFLGAYGMHKVRTSNLIIVTFFFYQQRLSISC